MVLFEKYRNDYRNPVNAKYTAAIVAENPIVMVYGVEPSNGLVRVDGAINFKPIVALNLLVRERATRFGYKSREEYLYSKYPDSVFLFQ